MNYAQIKPYDVANGPGIRVSLFVSGCTHHCKGCFNEVAWDFGYGDVFTEQTQEDIINKLNHSYIAGLSLLGGEPFELINQKGLLPLVRKVKQLYPEKNIWCYTGYDFQTDIMADMYEKYPETRELVEYLDILVDGKFVEELKDLNLRFCGSSNQRIIKVQQSIQKGELVLWDK